VKTVISVQIAAKLNNQIKHHGRVVVIKVQEVLIIFGFVVKLVILIIHAENVMQKYILLLVHLLQHQNVVLLVARMIGFINNLCL
jgi:hypothetical protein